MKKVITIFVQLLSYMKNNAILSLFILNLQKIIKVIQTWCSVTWRQFYCFVFIFRIKEPSPQIHSEIFHQNFEWQFCVSTIMVVLNKLFTFQHSYYLFKRNHKYKKFSIHHQSNYKIMFNSNTSTSISLREIQSGTISKPP